MNALQLIKRGLLNIDTLSTLLFVDLQKKVQNKDYIKNINTFLSRLFQLYNNDMRIDTSTTRIFLSAYIMMNHKEVVTNNDTYAIKLSDNATNMILYLETLFSDQKITMKDYNNFMNAFNRYIQFFQIWRERDSLLMARPIINSYFNTEIMISQLQERLSNNTELTDDKKFLTNDRINDLNRVLLKLKNNIRIVAGEKGLSFLESRDIPYFKDEEIFKSVEKTVRKAFWDVVSKNFEDEKYDQMITLLGDLKTMIVELVPNAKDIVNEMNQVIDIDLLTQMINAGLLNDQAIQTYINYIIEQIVKLQQPSEDINTQLFKENIESMFNKNEKRYVVLRYFFENTFNKLEKIKDITLRIKAQMKQ